METVKGWCQEEPPQNETKQKAAATTTKNKSLVVVVVSWNKGGSAGLNSFDRILWLDPATEFLDQVKKTSN